MDDELLLQPQTASELARAIKSNTHACLLIGDEGSGKYSLAKQLLSRKLGLGTGTTLDNYPYYLHIKPHNNTVAIDDIRQLQTFLQLTTTGKRAIRRGAIIEDAHFMTIEAQNALLKSLEEPPADTLIVLTATNGLHLRGTVHSRVQAIHILPVSAAQAFSYFGKQGLAETDIDQAYLISAGNAGLMSAILKSDTPHELLGQLTAVKNILAMPAFDRLSQIDSLAKQREYLPQFLYCCHLICKAALAAAAAKENRGQMSRWSKCLKAVYAAEAALIHNPNYKLLMTDLLLTL